MVTDFVIFNPPLSDDDKVWLSMEISEMPSELNCIDILTFDSSYIKVKFRLGLVLLEEENGVPGENHGPAASHWQTGYWEIAFNSYPVGILE